MFVVGAEDGNVDASCRSPACARSRCRPTPTWPRGPFDAARDGFVGTGGGAVVVLESEDGGRAPRRQGPTARSLGWGQASDGYNVAISHPDGSGLRAAMENALRAAGVAPEAVDYVNAHATSTPIGDISEARALKAVFRRRDAGRPSAAPRR